MSERLRTILVGAGQVGAGMAEDRLMAKHYPFATHAQVLAAHPSFEWGGVVEPDAERRQFAATKWRVPHAGASFAEVCARYSPEVVVVATPPVGRLNLLAEMPRSVRAVLLEKPLASTHEEAHALVDLARERGLLVEVNLWRRADAFTRDLLDGGLERRIGRPMGATLLYGNGLLNNGTHLVDLARLLFGEMRTAQALAPGLALAAGPIPGDVQFPFFLLSESGVPIFAQPIDFRAYRENGIEIWGERGRLSVLVEGLVLRQFPREPHRATEGAGEVSFDSPSSVPPTAGDAFYRMYSNLHAMVRDGAPPWSPLDSALATYGVVDALRRSLESGGSVERTNVR